MKGGTGSTLAILGFLIVATTLEATGDALVRVGLDRSGTAVRIGLFGAGGLLLFGYGLALNLAPTDFGRVVGLYIATLFIVWQIVNFVSFGDTPRMSTLVGGVLIIAGGLIVTFWDR